MSLHHPRGRLFLPAFLLIFCFQSSLLSAEERTPLPSLWHSESNGVKWDSLFRQSFFFLGLQHSFRIATEPDTRAGLGGSFAGGWMRSAANLHGWSDGDPFLVNYVGHPIEGAVAGFLFVQNDPKYQRTEFGRNREYWRSRLRAAGWAWAYSTQFELGPLSEASLGKIQSHFPQQGFVDHVITPSIGLSWMLAEDAVDRYLIRRLEARTDSKTLRILARGFLNPSRSMANVLRGNVPWHRDTREGVRSGRPVTDLDDAMTFEVKDAYRNERAYAPFELSVQYGYLRTGTGSEQARSCNGGSATALFNLTSRFGVEVEVGGCKMLSPDRNVSGDATLYLAGPRYTFRDAGRWSPFLHALAGGEKRTSETLYPERKPLLTPALAQLESYRLHSLYTTETATNSFALQVGGGVDYTVNRAIALRVANVEYLETYAPDAGGLNCRHNLRFTTGFVLRMGAW